MGFTSGKNISDYMAVGCLAAAALCLELVLTRILSALYFNHVAYIALTIALMGFGAAGVLVSIWGRKAGTYAIACSSAAFAVSIPLCVAIASRLPMWMPGIPVILKLLLSCIILAVPFLCVGAAIGLIFMKSRAAITHLYGLYLMASAVACLAFIGLLAPLGASNFIWFCVLLACAATAVFAYREHGVQARRLGILITLLLPIILSGITIVSPYPEPYKMLASNAYKMEADIEATRWTPIAKIDVSSKAVKSRYSDEDAAPQTMFKMITQDSDAHTVIAGPNAVELILRFARVKEVAPGPGASQTLLYLMREKTDESLVIGVGGGMDMVKSHAYGAAHTTGVEINPAIAEIVVRQNADFAVWPTWPEMQTVVSEGRRFVSQKKDAYDTITIGGLDTLAALNSGAYVLPENYLYTTEAFIDYMNALKSGGMVSVYRAFHVKMPNESLRIASLFLAASERLGIANPQRNILVVRESAGWVSWASTFIKKEPFTKEEITKVVAGIEQVPNLSVVYLPKIFPARQQKKVEQHVFAREAVQLAASRKIYEHFINPKAAQQRSQFYQRYPFDVTPVYDDRPFFFEYHKGPGMGNMLKGMSLKRGPAQGYLYLSLLACAGILAAAIIAPLTFFRREGMDTKGIPWLLAYFSFIGAGFMLVEIAMMQRLSLYLGHPVYTLAVVMAGLLLPAGAGASLSGWPGWTRQRLFLAGTAGVAAVVLLWLAVMPPLLAGANALPLPARIAVVLASLLPVGVMLGIPFAAGLNYVRGISPHFVPWAWGVGGIASVLASILAILLAMQAGFTAVLGIGAVTYLAGYAAIRKYRAS